MNTKIQKVVLLGILLLFMPTGVLAGFDAIPIGTPGCYGGCHFIAPMIGINGNNLKNVVVEDNIFDNIDIPSSAKGVGISLYNKYGDYRYEFVNYPNDIRLIGTSYDTSQAPVIFNNTFSSTGYGVYTKNAGGVIVSGNNFTGNIYAAVGMRVSGLKEWFSDDMNVELALTKNEYSLIKDLKINNNNFTGNARTVAVGSDGGFVINLNNGYPYGFNGDVSRNIIKTDSKVLTGWINRTSFDNNIVESTSDGIELGGAAYTDSFGNINTGVILPISYNKFKSITGTVVSVGAAKEVSLVYNDFDQVGTGVNTGTGTNISIKNNNVTSSGTGFKIPGMLNRLIRNNLFFSNNIAVDSIGSSGNIFTRNNFTLNTQDVVMNDVNANAWNTSVVGNWWDRYRGPDADSDGIGDEPYPIATGAVLNIDHKPAYIPFSITQNITPEEQPGESPLTTNRYKNIGAGTGGIYTSKIFDAGSLAAWETITVQANKEGYTVYTRTSVDGITWSVFQYAVPNVNGGIDSPEGRYMQYKIAANSGVIITSATLSGVRAVDTSITSTSKNTGKVAIGGDTNIQSVVRK